MRVRTLAAILAIALLNLSCGARAQQSANSAKNTSGWNNSSLIAIQKKGGDPARAGDVKIRFYGHDAFEITSPEGLSVLTDPWRNDSSGAFPKWFVREFPPVQVHIVVSTHAHFDHDAVELPRGLVVLDRLVGQFKLGDVAIIGLAEKHASDPQSAETPLDNMIQILKTGGLRIAVWGDNRAAIDPALDHYLKNVDVLILPVESVLTDDEVNVVLAKYEPKAVIPSHYFVRGLTTDGSGVESVDAWVSGEERVRHTDVRQIDSADLTLNPSQLKKAHHRIYYFGDHVAVK